MLKISAVALLASAMLASLPVLAQTRLTIPNANVSASSSDSNLPVNANDGSLATRWSADATNGAQWLQYNLGGCYKISYANLAWYSGDSRKYNLSLKISNDGNTWTDVFNGTNSGTTAQLKPYSFADRSARYVRLQATGSNVNNWVSLSEMEIWTNGAGSCSGLNPNQPPGGNFDLSIWQLQLPVGSPGSPETKTPSQLEGGYTSAYFYTDTDGAMTFWCPETGVTTPNSDHPRSELREMNANGSAANWDIAGTHIMNATVKVVKVPSSTAIGQIHIGTALQSGLPSSTKPLLELYYRSSGDIVLGIENSPAGGQTPHTLTNIPLNTTFTYQIKATSSTITVSINGTPYSFPLPQSFIGYGEYFKAGNYIQSNGTDPNNGALVKFYALNVSHN
ncbi:F5/8 type C domain-containing protein [Duganella sacchari]|uniref:F5/8 type C domain-containing protein n=1 Tax=Duganella sacchari TaxID=551987 RepID=A0A1M7LC56_9BURK|nr:polysaccharide lyase family 7 protein [Duganella sacchari]SHM75159.1 F5/8 type C domain-containing protein [Duganella sacchari]